MSQLSSSISTEETGLVRTCIEETHIDRPERLDRGSDGSGVVFALGHVHPDRDGGAVSCGVDRVGDGLRFGFVQIADAHIGTLRGKACRIGSTHAARGSGDQDVLTFEAIGVHGFLPR